MSARTGECVGEGDEQRKERRRRRSLAAAESLPLSLFLSVEKASALEMLIVAEQRSKGRECAGGAIKREMTRDETEIDLSLSPSFSHFLSLSIHLCV